MIMFILLPNPTRNCGIWLVHDAALLSSKALGRRAAYVHPGLIFVMSMKAADELFCKPRFT